MPKLMKAEIYQIKKGQLPIDWKEDMIIRPIDDHQKIAEIIIEKPFFNSRKVKEFLTGVEFDYMYWDAVPSYDFTNLNDFVSYLSMYRAKSRSIDTYVIITRSHFKEPSSEEVREYYNNHKNIEDFSNYLKDIKTRGEQIAKESIASSAQKNFNEEINEQMTKRLIKDIRTRRKAYNK